MTAAEWRERKVVTDLDTEAILADLAACEVSLIQEKLALEYCGNECKLAMDKAIKAEKERDEWKDHAERFLERAEKAEAVCEEWADRYQMLEDRAASIVADRDRLQKFAIGGDGTTHWYYRDEYERVVAERDDLRRKLEEALWDGVIDAASKITMADGRKLSDWTTLMNLLRDGYDSAIAALDAKLGVK